MSTKALAISAVVLLLTGYAFGRYASPEKVKVETHETKQTQTDKELESDKHKETHTTTTTQKDGTQVVHIDTIEDSTKHLQSDRISTTYKSKSTETTYSSSKMTLSALGGVDGFFPPKLVYGVSASKPFLGPITGGLWLLSSGVAGISLGLTF